MTAVALAIGLGFVAAWRGVLAGGPPPPVAGVVTESRVMALTVNVVWGTEYVPQLLAILRRHHVVATFMLGGAWAQAHPDLVRALYDAGMEIGNHGWAHRHMSLLGPADVAAEISRTQQAVAAITGKAPRLFAPPYGEYNGTVLGEAARLGLPVVLWTLDTIDWRPSSSPTQIVNRVVLRARPGAIVLLHPTDRTVEALPQILDGLARQDYRLVTVSDLLTLGRPTPER